MLNLNIKNIDTIKKEIFKSDIISEYHETIICDLGISLSVFYMCLVVDRYISNSIKIGITINKGIIQNHTCSINLDEIETQSDVCITNLNDLLKLIIKKDKIKLNTVIKTDNFVSKLNYLTELKNIDINSLNTIIHNLLNCNIRSIYTVNTIYSYKDNSISFFVI